jgi:hypothetical protein
MQKQRWFFKGILVLLLILGILLTGCLTEAGGGDNKDDSLFSEKADGKLLVNNTSADDLVLFYDTVMSSKLLGGLPGNASGHRIKLPSVGSGFSPPLPGLNPPGKSGPFMPL